MARLYPAVLGATPRGVKWPRDGLAARRRGAPPAPPRIGALNAMTTPEVPSTDPASYEAALEELEQLVGLIESGQLPLEQLLTGYQRGAQLLQFCREKLQAVENQIKVLDEGTLKPWTQE